MKKFASIFLVWVLAACGGENTQSSSAGGSNTQLPPSERAIVAATAEAHKDDAPVPGEIATKAPAREVTGERVAYGELDGANLYGYLAMPAEMTSSYGERTSLMTYRVFFVSVSTLVATALAPWLLGMLGGGRTGFTQMSMLMAVWILLAMLVTVFSTHRVNFTQHVG